jgi:ribosomal protein RSM22 (predicted rRNA methylase)
MNSTLPEQLKHASDALLEGVSRKELAVRSQAITAHYRGGQGSRAAITGKQDALAYLVARLPATYAVAAAVFDAVRAASPDFTPASLLDAGAGPGTASWAALETWPGLSDITLADANATLLALAESLAVGTALAPASFLSRDLATGHLPEADLVVANFVLAEIAAQELVVDRLYAAARNVLVLIEPGTPDGFGRIRAARDRLIGQSAHVLGPCTHANACPMIAPDWCHFSQRLPRSRDHMHAKGANVPYEDERYAWVAVSRERRSVFEGHGRILAQPRETKPGIEFKLCTPDGLEQRFIARRDREAYADARKKGWGDLL